MAVSEEFLPEIDNFSFEFEEDDFVVDDFAVETATTVGDWVKIVDKYHFRGLDLAVITAIDAFAIEVRWQSDGSARRYALDEVIPVFPSPAEIAAATARHSQMDLTPQKRIDPKSGRSFAQGEFVTAASPYCRHGAQLGTIAHVLPNDQYIVYWQHVIGCRPKDARRSYQPFSWLRSDLISAQYVEPVLSAKTKKLSSKKR